MQTFSVRDDSAWPPPDQPCDPLPLTTSCGASGQGRFHSGKRSMCDGSRREMAAHLRDLSDTLVGHAAARKF